MLLIVSVAGHYGAIVVYGRSRWPRRFLGAAARTVGAEVRIAGRLSAAPLLIIANHVSWLDILVIAGATGSAFVGHDGLARQPFLRWLCRLNHTVFIARDDRGSTASQAAQVRAALVPGGVLTLFPEGTTGDGVTLRRFKSSLLAAVEPVPAGLSVQPVLIDYGRAAAQIAWTDAEPGLRNFTRLLARPGRLPTVLHVLPALAGADLRNRKAMTSAAFVRIASVLDRSA